MTWPPPKSFLDLSSLLARLASALEIGALPTPGEWRAEKHLGAREFSWLSLSSRAVPSAPRLSSPSYQSHLSEGLEAS